jgi:predicted HTH domain antitoxin
MERLAMISRTDLARRTRQMVDRVRRGDMLIVESYGEEQVVIMDVTDYRIMRAVAAYHHLPPHPSPANDPNVEPGGLSEEELAKYLQREEVVRAAGGETQARWNRVMTAYLDGHINLGRAARLLDLSRYELDERFRRLDVPRRVGAETVEEAQAEVEAALAGTSLRSEVFTGER